MIITYLNLHGSTVPVDANSFQSWYQQYNINNNNRKKSNGDIHVIPYIHSPVMGLFPQILMVTMTMFPGTSLIIKETNCVK